MRYLPLTDDDRQEMLAAIGAPNIEALYKDVAQEVLLDKPVDLPTTKGEMEVEQIIAGLAAKNLGAGAAPFFLGAGNYSHHIHFQSILSYNTIHHSHTNHIDPPYNCNYSNSLHQRGSNL